MNIVTTTLVERQSIAAQELLSVGSAPLQLMAPGATTTCLGSSCCSCCCSAASAA